MAAKKNPSGDRFFHEIEALSKALSLGSNSRPRPTRRLSTGGAAADSKPKDKDKKKPPSSSSSSTSSIWNWRPLKALSHSRHRRLDVRFTFKVHSIESLPPPLSGAALLVHWRRASEPSGGAHTRPAKAFHGAAEFEETLSYRCTVYATKSSGGARYEPRQFLIFATVAGAPGLDLGKHRVDLTRVLPVDLEELETEKGGSGEWSTGFRLSGKATGASLNVSFGFSVEPGGGDRKVSEILNPKAVGEKKNSNSLGRVGSLHNRSEIGGKRSNFVSQSGEDVKVLHEVLPREKQLESVDSKREMEGFAGQSDSPIMKCCMSEEPAKGNGERECEEPEFMVIEQGVEVASVVGLEKVEPESSDKGIEVGQELVGVEPDRQDLTGDSVVEDSDSAIHSLAILEVDEMKLPKIGAEVGEELSYENVKSKYRSGGMKSKSLCLDDATDSVASEFLSMLGIEHSPFGLSSESDPESPRERLWKQFEKESLSTGDAVFGLDIGTGSESNWDGYSEETDFSSVIRAAEMGNQKETCVVESKSRAQMLEDLETEVLMREWGLNEKAFDSSPPGSRSGFGSPIHLPPEELLELPPLGENLGPVVQTKDGGFLRSMSPSLFKNSKNKGSLVMQVSNPVVVPAEMGSDVMEVLQTLASVGIEKLSMQASKLMPLEGVTGMTMQQLSWEASPTLEACESEDLFHDLKLRDLGNGQSVSGRAKTHGKGSNLFSSRGGHEASEYVSLEDLAPLAMDKIEALSIEGLRIQSDMSDEEAPSNISQQCFGEISALEGKGASDSGRSLGLEGIAGLKLLDVKDSEGEVDGLMGLSITLDEWMRLDSGVVDEEDQISDRTSKILSAHHAKSTEFFGGGKGDKRGGKRRWGLLGNNFTVALMVQLRDPLRDYEPVGTPMLSLIQVERVFLPPKPKIYNTVSEKGNSEPDDESDIKPEPKANEEKKVEEDAIPQFKITEVHLAGLKTEPTKKKLWGNSMQQQSGSRWLLANGMGKSNKHPFMKSNAATKPSQTTTKVQPGETLWSISSRVHGTGAKWKEIAALNPHIRNPNIIFPNETIRLR